jgi:hypothetical protein
MDPADQAMAAVPVRPTGAATVTARTDPVTAVDQAATAVDQVDQAAANNHGHR